MYSLHVTSCTVCTDAVTATDSYWYSTAAANRQPHKLYTLLQPAVCLQRACESNDQSAASMQDVTRSEASRGRHVVNECSSDCASPGILEKRQDGQADTRESCFAVLLFNKGILMTCQCIIQNSNSNARAQMLIFQPIR